MSKKDSINRRIMVIFISITSIVLISFGSIITVLFNKNYHSTKLSNLEKQMDIIETSINNYLNQQDGSYQQLKQIIKMACISTNSEAIITDRLGYVYLVNGEDYENLLYSKIELDTESLSSNIEFKKDVYKINNTSIKGYVKAIYEDDEIDGYMIMVTQDKSERNFNMNLAAIGLGGSTGSRYGTKELKKFADTFERHTSQLIVNEIFSRK